MIFASRLRGYALSVGATASLLMIAPGVSLAATGAHETPTVLLTQGDTPTPAGAPPSPTTPKAGPPAPKNLEPLAPDELQASSAKKSLAPTARIWA